MAGLGARYKKFDDGVYPYAKKFRKIWENKIMNKNIIKTAMLTICAILAIFALSNDNLAYAADEDSLPTYVPTNDELITPEDLGPAIWMSADGITHTSDGLAWGPDGVVYVEAEVEDDFDLGPAIWMDATGVTHTSDGLAWGPDGIIYFEGVSDDTDNSFCVNHSTKLNNNTDIGTATWCDERGNVHNLDNVCFINLTVDESGVITSNVGGMDMLFDCSTVVVTYYLQSTNSILFQVLNADTYEELLAVVVSLPM